MRIPLLAILLIVSFTAISVVSLVCMSDKAGCFAESLNGTARPLPSDPFSLLRFHFSTYTKLVQALLFSFALLFFLSFPIFSFGPSSILTRLSSLRRSRFHTPLLLSLKRWTALHEVSPTR